jgi:hypothetical protein
MVSDFISTAVTNKKKKVKKLSTPNCQLKMGVQPTPEMFCLSNNGECPLYLYMKS